MENQNGNLSILRFSCWQDHLGVSKFGVVVGRSL